MLSRTKGRENLLKVYYQYLFYLPSSERPGAKEIFYSVFKEEDDASYYRSMFAKAISNAGEIIIRAEPLLENWQFDRLPLTDQAIIILADTEFRHFDVPRNVIINVYVELAKAYGGDESTYKFINALLEKLL